MSHGASVRETKHLYCCEAEGNQSGVKKNIKHLFTIFFFFFFEDLDLNIVRERNLLLKMKEL